MRETKSSSRSRLQKLSRLTLPLTAAALALATLSAQAQARAAAMRDLGVVAPSTTMSAVVWLKGHGDASFDAAAGALSDSSSDTYHQWMQDADIARFEPSTQELAAARASLTALGLNIDKVYDGGTLVRVSGSAAKLQAAFGTTIHAVQSADGSTLFKAATTPTYQGARADLVGGVSGLSGSAMTPFIARQIDFATGAAVPAVVAQAGTDPLAAFTSSCFGPTFTETMSGLARSQKQTGFIVSTATGPTYLDPTKTVGRPSCGYNAQQLVKHYGIDEAHALGLRGRGQTIVIIDAYGSPTALKDINLFSKAMGLPQMTDKEFTVVYPDGAPASSDPNWASETTLDIEWAHAFAPEAKIVLAVAPSSDNAELAYAVQYAADHHLGNVVSNSWGAAEAASDKNTAQMFDQVFKHAAARGIAINVASGDSGDNALGTPVGAAGVPEDSAYVTAVGGTSINIPSDNGPVEAAWGINVTSFGTTFQPYLIPDAGGFVQGGGGGESVFLKKPSWQHKLPGAGRQTPDVAALADPQTGAIVVQTDPVTGAADWYIVGGTSLATPIFSAIWALADEAAGESLGQAAPIVSTLPPFAMRDVLPIQATKHPTTATLIYRGGTPVNYTALQLIEPMPTQPTGFFSALVFVGAYYQGWNDVGFGLDSSLAAAPGWDNATGYGVPNGLLFIESAQVFGRHR